MTDTGRDGRVACTLTGSEQLRRRDRWLRLAEVALVSTKATEWASSCITGVSPLCSPS